MAGSELELVEEEGAVGADVLVESDGGDAVVRVVELVAADYAEGGGSRRVDEIAGNDDIKINIVCSELTSRYCKLLTS